MRTNLAFVTAFKMVTRAFYYTIEGFMLESLYYAIKLSWEQTIIAFRGGRGHSDNILASCPAALDSILGIPKFFLLMLPRFNA